MAALAAGCADEHLPKPNLALPAAYEAPAAPASSTVSLDRWWTLFHDDQLETLVDEALNHAPDARTALAVLAHAHATRRETLDRLYIPSEKVGASTTHNRTNILQSSPGTGLLAPPDESDQGQFSVSWELDLFGRRAAGKAAANADLNAAAFDSAATRTALAANVAQTLFQARGLALQRRDAEEAGRVQRELARAAQARADAGLTATADADQAEAGARTSDAEAKDLAAQQLAAQRTLLVLIGRGFDAVESLPASAMVGAPPTIPAALPGDLLRRRPDVRAAEQRVLSASSTLKVADLALLPTIALNPAATLFRSTGPFGYATAAWSVGASLTAPVLDRPRLTAHARVQRPVAEQAVVAYEKAVQTAYGETETALNNLQSDRQRVDLLTVAEHRARSAYDKAQAGYASGLNDVTAPLQAEATWRTARRALTAAEITSMERAVQLSKALGGGWRPDGDVLAEASLPR
jgi:NodT family efflux transporter outer membrane factor (OMF) lipoprotein